jgi:hypothetical protein
MLVLLAWPSGAFAEESCLRPAVGDAISRQLEAHAFEGVLPPGWALMRLDVFPDRIEIGVRDDGGRRVVVTLRVRRAPERTADGSGRSFNYFIDPGAVHLDAASRNALVRLATLVDAAVPEDDVRDSCDGSFFRPGQITPNPAWTEHGAPLPRAVALPLAAAEVLAVAGALAFVRRRRSKASEAGVGGFGWLEKGAVFCGAFLALHRIGGSHAVLWLDTINDQRDVTNCLAQNACTSLGETTSIGGLQHAVAWLHFRTLTTLAGLSVDVMHVLLQVMNAVGVVLAASSACRVGGRIAGAFAAVASVLWVSNVGNPEAVHNVTILPFLGAVLLVVGAEAAERPGVPAIALTAVVGAILANVHFGCVMTGVSVVWIALLAPKQKLRLAAVGAGVFVAAAFVIAPGTWLHAVARGWTLVRTLGGVPSRVEGNGSAGLMGYGGLFLLAVVVAFGIRRHPRPRPFVIDVSAATALPMLGAVLAVLGTSAFPMSAKYLAHLAAPGAVLCAAPVALLVLETRGRPGFGWARVPEWLPRAGRLLPYLSAALLVALPTVRDERRESRFTFHDLEGVPRELQRRGWSYAHVYRGLKSPEDAIVLAGLEMLAPTYGVGPSRDDSTNAYLLKVATRSLPSPLPPDWVVVSESGSRSVILVFARTSLDWAQFQACDTSSSSCNPSGLALGDDEKPRCAYCVPGMPNFADHSRRTFELRLRTSQSDGERAIWMPRQPGVCGGRVVAAPGPSPAISSDGRHATWVAPVDGEVRIDWEIASPECERWAYTGFPPFFFEGDVQTVGQVQRLAVE